MTALQMFIGYCEVPPPIMNRPKIAVPPPAFFKYARELELSLTPNFPIVIPCADPYCHRQEDLHNVYDFHWLRLHEFQNLSNINIWVTARGIPLRFDKEHDFISITQLDVDAVAKALSCFGNINSITLSTPLSRDIGPEDGYVEGIARPGIRLWKRGSGDRFHPHLVPIRPGRTLDGVIRTSASRYVQVLVPQLRFQG